MARITVLVGSGTEVRLVRLVAIVGIVAIVRGYGGKGSSKNLFANYCYLLLDAPVKIIYSKKKQTKGNSGVCCQMCSVRNGMKKR